MISTEVRENAKWRFMMEQWLVDFFRAMYANSGEESQTVEH
jgi:hypothetical protein